MKAQDARPFLDSIAADLAAEADPSLRAWYETEIKLTPDHAEATVIQDKLQALHDGIGHLIGNLTLQEEQESQASHTEEATVAANNSVPELVYVSPEEKKRQTVLSKITEAEDKLDFELTQAKQQTKASKQRKHEQIALRRFGRSFEDISGTGRHLVHDPDALETVLRHLQSSPDVLTQAVKSNCIDYMHENGIEFAEDSEAFAKLLDLSTDESLGETVDQILSGIYEKKSFIQHPEQAAALYISLARASLVPTTQMSNAFYAKVNNTASLRNDIIRNKSEFNAGVKAVLMSGHHVDELARLAGDLWNARLTTSQFRQAFLSEQLGEEERLSTNEQLFGAARSIGQRYGGIEKMYQFVEEWKKQPDFFQHPQHAEVFSVFNLADGEALPLNFTETEIPESIRSYFYASDLFRLRKERVAPRAIAHDLIRSTLPRELKINTGEIAMIDIGLSPATSITIGTNVSTEHASTVVSGVVTTLIQEYAEGLLANLPQASSHEDIGRFGRLKVDLSKFGFEIGSFADVYLRRSIPEDFVESRPYPALTTSFMQEDLTKNQDIEIAETLHREKVAYISEHRNRYLGRRPIHFSLPERFKARGLEAIEIRQHPDRKHIYVSAIHREGRLEFCLDENFIDVGQRRAESHPYPLLVAFEDLVVTLASEWICRPAVETTEGTVSIEDTKSPVNLGFLRHVPVGASFSHKQQQAFLEEQRGDLSAESTRRRPLDPTGQGRNSTYVRENYDPTKPPLEVFYDTAVIS